MHIYPHGSCYIFMIACMLIVAVYFLASRLSTMNLDIKDMNWYGGDFDSATEAKPTKLPRLM